MIFSTLLIKQLMLYTVDESTDFGDVVVPSEEVERALRELVVNKSCGVLMAVADSGGGGRGARAPPPFGKP